MKYRELIERSKLYLEEKPDSINNKFSVNIFSLGAKWMFDKLNEMDNNKERKFDVSINYNFYGTLKYGICLCAFTASFFLFYKINALLIPLSIFVFYFFEVHFLFLFPILIDNVKNPILTSMRQTYKIGVLQSMLTVIPIGIFMVLGLFNLNDPFRNWHIGCYSILIWYQDEVRNRL